MPDNFAISVSTIISLLALGVSIRSLRDSNKTSKKQLQLEKHTSELSKKQLSQIEAQEKWNNQPQFIFNTLDISGSDPEQTGLFIIKAKIKIEKRNEVYLKIRSISVIQWDKKRIMRPNYKAHLTHNKHDPEKGTPLLGEHELTIHPNAQLSSCFLHIKYIDIENQERIQEFKILPEGPFESMPSDIKFMYNRTLHIEEGKWKEKYSYENIIRPNK